MKVYKKHVSLYSNAFKSQINKSHDFVYVLYVSHRVFNIFLTKSTISYNLGPKLSLLDVRQGFSLFLMGFRRIIKISEYFKICKNTINLIQNKAQKDILTTNREK